MLLPAFRHDQFLSAQWPKIGDESAGLHKTGNIEVHGIAHCRVRVADHHLARPNQNRIARMSRPIKSTGALQHQKFTSTGMIFDHDGRPRDRGRDASRMNCRAICALCRLNEHRALTQVQIARPVFEIKRGVGCQPHNCFVGKSQFSVRLLASSHNRFLVHNIVHRRSLRRARGVRQLHVIAYSRDARFARGQRA